VYRPTVKWVNNLTVVVHQSHRRHSPVVVVFVFVAARLQPNVPPW